MDSNRCLHDRVLAAYGQPAWLVRSERNGGQYKDLRHDRWIICTDDPKLVRKAERVIDFALPVDVGSVLLTDRAGDLLTAKILVAESLNGQLLTPKSAGVVVSLFSNYGWFVRWKLSLGIEKTSDLTPAILEDFFDKLRAGGVYSLVPLNDRIQDLEERVKGGHFRFPVKSPGTNLVELKKVHAELGLAARSLPDAVSHVINGMIRRVAPELKTKSDTRRSWRGERSSQTADEESTGDAGRPAVSFSEQVLGIFAELYRLSAIHALDHDPLKFDPFKKTSLHNRARQIGRQSQRTRTMGPEQWLALMESAATWVVDLAEPATRIAKEAREAFARMELENPSKRAREAARKKLPANLLRIVETHWPARAQHIEVMPEFRRPGTLSGEDSRLTINDLIYYLVASCFVLVGAFSARRRRELESLQVGCAAPDENGNWWLSSYIEKTIRDVDQIPVPSSVGLAIKRLEELSEPVRNVQRTPWLIDVPLASVQRPMQDGAPTNNRTYAPDCLTMIKHLAAISDIPLTHDGQSWEFGTHQLRRAFAVHYYYGFRYANLDALSRFLRHFDPEMTRIYITDVIPGLLLELKERRKSHERLVEAATGATDAEVHRAALRNIDQISVDFSGMVDAFTEVKESATVERMLDIYDGAEAPIGLNAPVVRRDLEKMIEKARQDIRIASPYSNGSPDDLRQALMPQLRTYAKTKNMEPVPGGTIACGWSPKLGDDLQYATCIKAKHRSASESDTDVRPDYAYASIETCLDCRFCLVFSQNRHHIDRVLADAQSAATRAPSEGLRDAARARVAAYKSKLRTASSGGAAV